MAKDTAKKAHKSNQSRLQSYFIISLVINVIYFVWRIWWLNDSFFFLNGVGFLLLIGGELFALKGLISYAAPQYDSDGRIDSCNDLLNIEGMTSYLQDVLWISWFVQLTTLLSKWFWLVYLVIPCYGLHLGYTSILRPLMLMRSASAMGPPEEQKLSKRQEKLEKRRQKAAPQAKRGFRN
eukprot:NODE_5294_length_673_cov_145.934066_g5131_i0.p1 GENE.NODE_5294_length_673_cov_145.934066_g5131_i0~~NODE_5294_length_673_cov_145.934066_g5131_i0.p1  ORF type:complete len:180 (-),score=30.55 NODE_5294_length_673_cov_145.934066_g5131_i0:82-621(-)